MDTERLTYRVEEVARITGCPDKTLYRLIRTGKIPAFRIGRAVYVKAADVRRLFGGETTHTTAKEGATA